MVGITPALQWRYGHSVGSGTPSSNSFLGYTWTHGLVQVFKKQMHVSHTFLETFFSHGHLPTSITVCYRPLPFGYHVKQENDPRRFSPAKQIILRMFSVDLRLGGMQAIHRNFWKFTGWKQAGSVPIYLIGNLHEINPSEATMRKSHLSCIITASMEYKEASKLHKVKDNQNDGPTTNQTPRHTGVS